MSQGKFNCTTWSAILKKSPILTLKKSKMSLAFWRKLLNKAGKPMVKEHGEGCLLAGRCLNTILCAVQVYRWKLFNLELQNIKQL